MKTIQEYIKIAHLTAKRLMGCLTAEEKDHLSEWREANRLGRGSGMELHLGLAQSEERYAEVDADCQWMEFCRRMNRKRRMAHLRVAGIAAGLCLIVCVPWILQLQSEKAEELPVVVKKEGIQLILSNGKSVDLSDRRNLDLRQVEGNVVLHNGRLEYRADSADVPVQVAYNTLVIPKGAFYHLTLSDGTGIWLNSDSKITYPTRFTGDVREVELEGEAFFDVRKSKLQPFIVKTSALQVKVLGTAFNVNTYGDKGKVYAALERGKVEVRCVKGDGCLVLSPGEVAELEVGNPSGGLRLSAVSLQEQLAWKEGMFCFRQLALPDILKQVERYYDVRFVGVENIRHEVFSGDISRNVTLDELLGAISAQLVNLRFEIVDNVVYIIKERD